MPVVRRSPRREDAAPRSACVAGRAFHQCVHEQPDLHPQPHQLSLVAVSVDARLLRALRARAGQSNDEHVHVVPRAEVSHRRAGQTAHAAVLDRARLRLHLRRVFSSFPSTSKAPDCSSTTTTARSRVRRSARVRCLTSIRARWRWRSRPFDSCDASRKPADRVRSGRAVDGLGQLLAAASALHAERSVCVDVPSRQCHASTNVGRRVGVNPRATQRRRARGPNCGTW